MIVDSHQRDYPPGDEDDEWVIVRSAMFGPRLHRPGTDKAFGANAARFRGLGANG